MTAVSFSISDSPGLLQLWNRSTPYDEVNEDVFYEKIWGDSGFNQDLGLVVHKDKQPIAMALGVVRDMLIERRGYIKLLVVAPEFRRQGIAHQLVEQLQDKLCRLEVAAIRVGESAPNYLFPGIDSRYTEAIKFFESLGFKKVGTAYNLLAELADLELDCQSSEEELIAKGIVIRRARHKDQSAIDALIAKYWLAWRSEIAIALSNKPISLHLAIKNEQVVGFSAYDSNNLGTGWFGPMGTHPEVRGLGIGRAMMIRCLKDIKKQGHRQAIIAWVSPTSLYAKHANAKPDRTFHRYEKRFLDSDAARELSRK